MTDVAVVIPWRHGSPHREAALEWCLRQWSRRHPLWRISFGESPEGPFNRSAAIVDGFGKTTAEITVVTDGDVWCEGVQEAVEHAHEFGWAVPHANIHRLSADSTRNMLTPGFDWRVWKTLPLSGDNARDKRPYRGNECGTLVMLRNDVLLDVPPDVRFVGWGQEDEAWAFALRTLVGPPWRGDADLVHLWHPPQPRQDRRVGSPAGAKLLHRYRQAQGQKRKMRTLIDESKELWTPALLEQLQK